MRRCATFSLKRSGKPPRGRTRATSRDGHQVPEDCVLRCIRCGTYVDDHDIWGEAAAAAERRAIVAWLRHQPSVVGEIVLGIADTIERGDHRKEQT